MLDKLRKNKHILKLTEISKPLLAKTIHWLKIFNTRIDAFGLQYLSEKQVKWSKVSIALVCSIFIFLMITGNFNKKHQVTRFTENIAIKPPVSKKQPVTKESKERDIKKLFNKLPVMHDFAYFDNPDRFMDLMMENKYMFDYSESDIELGLFEVDLNAGDLNEFEAQEITLAVKEDFKNNFEKAAEEAKSRELIKHVKFTGLGISGKIDVNGRIQVEWKNIADEIPAIKNKLHYLTKEEKEKYVKTYLGKYSKFYPVGDKKNILYGVLPVLDGWVNDSLYRKEDKVFSIYYANLPSISRSTDETKKLIVEIGKKNGGHIVITEMTFKYNRLDDFSFDDKSGYRMLFKLSSFKLKDNNYRFVELTDDNKFYAAIEE